MSSFVSAKQLPNEPAVSLAPDGAAAPPRRKARVLIVDDDELTTATFAQMLRLQGHDVRTSQNPQTALRDTPALAPDAIIVDLHMPVMDGLTFIQSLREQEQRGGHVPVAMVTGDYSMSPSVTHALEDLGVTVCFKPLWLEDITQLTDSLLATPKH